jgi:hypothetical protein
MRYIRSATLFRLIKFQYRFMVVTLVQEGLFWGLRFPLAEHFYDFFVPYFFRYYLKRRFGYDQRYSVQIGSPALCMLRFYLTLLDRFMWIRTGDCRRE